MAWVFPANTPCRGQASSSPLRRARATGSLQPDFTPERIDCAGAEPPALSVACFTDDVLEHDGVGLEPDHLAGLFIYNLLQPFLNFVFAFGERDHFRIKVQPAVAIAEVESLQDFAVGFDADNLAFAQAEPLSWRLDAFWYAEWPQRVRGSTGDALKAVIGPPHEPANANARLSNRAPEEVQQACSQLGYPHVARRIILHVLSYVPPLQRLCRELHLRVLAYVRRLTLTVARQNLCA